MEHMSHQHSTPRRGARAAVLRAFGIEEKQPLDVGLSRISERLGLSGSRATIEPRKAAPIRVERTEDHPRSILYSPDIDGQADSGEVVWVWAPTDGANSLPHERAVLVVARNHTNIVGLLISPNPTHEKEDWWLEIGAGEWDETGRQCWIRLDRVLEISEEDVRRRGILFPQRRFDRIANRLRMVYHWA